MSTNLLSFGGKILTVGGNALSFSSADPYNPLDLPPYTIRLKFNDGVTPSFSKGIAVQVSSSPNVWDLTYENTNWEFLIDHQAELTEVLGANATGVTSAKGMIRYCPVLTSIALFDTSSVTNMHGAFAGNTSLTTIPLFDTSSVTTMEAMFWDCPALTSVPLLDTSSVTTMASMFRGCTSLTTVPLFDTSSVTTVYEMFRGCTALTTVPLFNTSSVTRFEQMFYGCSSLTSVPLFDTSAATNMASILARCTSITAVPLFDTSSATTLRGMLYGCTAITAIPLFDTSSATDVLQMLENCTAVSSGALALYQQMSGQANPPSIHSQCFEDCGSNTVTGAAELAQIPVSWGGTQREWQDNYYIEIIPSTLNRNVAFGKFYTNDLRQSVTSVQIKDGSWISLSSSTVDNLNNNANYIYADVVDGFRAYFTKAADLVSLRYSSSGGTIGVNVTVYGKRIGSSSWSTVATTSSTQGGNIYITV